MRRALVWVVIAALGFAALKTIRVGHTTLWTEASELWHSRLIQGGLKSLGDPLLERLRPQGDKKKGEAPRRESKHSGSGTIFTDSDGPEEDRDLPPAPIPPPREPLKA